MTQYTTEQEQIDQLKKWLRIYFLPAIVGIITGITIFYTWQSYCNHRNSILEQASVIYDHMINSYIQNNLTEVKNQAAELSKTYPNTNYNLLAQFVLAKIDVKNRNYPDAINKLNWVIAHSKQSSIRQISRLRLARIYLAQNNPQQALQILAKLENIEFTGLVNEIKGDAYFALQNFSQAKLAYKQALESLPHAQESRPLLQMKFDNLA